MAFTKEEWRRFQKENPDFPATDAMCRELEKKATEEGISLDEAWKRMKKEGRIYHQEEGSNSEGGI